MEERQRQIEAILEKRLENTRQATYTGDWVRDRDVLAWWQNHYLIELGQMSKDELAQELQRVQ